MRLSIRCLVFVSTLLVSIAVLAEPPKAMINGPTEGYPGDFIDLDASESIGDFYEWRVEPAQFPDGRRTYRLDRGAAPQKSVGCAIASRPGVYRVTLIVSKDSEGIATKDWVVTILKSPGDQPAAPPTVPSVPTTPTVPTVPTTPVVPAPPPQSGIGSWIKQNLPAVTDPNRKLTQTLLSASYSSYALMPDNAPYSPTQFAQGQDNLNKLTFQFTGTQQYWDGFMQGLAQRLASLNLQTIPQMKVVWNEIAEALKP